MAPSSEGSGYVWVESLSRSPTINDAEAAAWLHLLRTFRQRLSARGVVERTIAPGDDYRAVSTRLRHGAAAIINVIDQPDDLYGRRPLRPGQPYINYHFGEVPGNPGRDVVVVAASRIGDDQALEQLMSLLPQSVFRPGPVTRAAEARGYVFLSYADEDREFVKRITEFLRLRKYAYWDYRTSDRAYGESFPREIERVIRGAAAVFCILSPAWRDSGWTEREFLFAEQAGIPALLLLVSQMEPDLLIVNRTPIDFTTDPEDGFAKLGRELDHRRL